MPETTTTPPAGTPHGAEYALPHLHIPDAVYKASQRALQRQYPATVWRITQYHPRFAEIAAVAYAAGVVDGRQTGIQDGRDLAGEDIENAARSYGRTGEDFITVATAARIARGGPYTDEEADRG